MGRLPSTLPPRATRAEFAGFKALPEDQEQGADAVILGDMGEARDFRTLNLAFRLLMVEPRPHLVRAGKFRPEDLRLGALPDGMLTSIADLPDWWEATTSAGLRPPADRR